MTKKSSSIAEATTVEATAVPAEYKVLARKYRPVTFAQLIGQEAMVRTLTNAVESGRLAHAFILTGVRGVGKTTTARLISRALNCIGKDAQGGPTIKPCGVCEHCCAIAEDRHMDILELDAASRTGVDDIREIIEGVAYRPTSARFKVYIVDEVHMLSKSAFNALLKTLEEPPEHVKFIFATTEIRRVPVTVLSRCQRFDLRRVNVDTLMTHFSSIAKQEGADVTHPALALIARAADGSVRDGLSLLDQSIAHGSGKVDETQVRDMLGLADRAVTFDILESVLKGNINSALDLLDTLYRSGADPLQLLEDMLDLVHWLTRIKVVPEFIKDSDISQIDRAQDLVGQLSMASLARVWQMLLKGLNEALSAPLPLQSVEMILIRLAYTAELPSPNEIVSKLVDKEKPTTAKQSVLNSGQNTLSNKETTLHTTQSNDENPINLAEQTSSQPNTPEAGKDLTEVKKHPLVQQTLKTFPDARLEKVHHVESTQTLPLRTLNKKKELDI